MLTRNDSIILSQQVDVNKAMDLLNMFKEAGKNRIDIQTAEIIRRNELRMQVEDLESTL